MYLVSRRSSSTSSGSRRRASSSTSLSQCTVSPHLGPVSSGAIVLEQFTPMVDALRDVSITPLRSSENPPQVLVVGIAIGIVGFTLLAVAHSAPWQIIGAGLLINIYISLAYGALPSLVVREVDVGETGVATSMNAIARTVGASMAAAIVAVLLSRNGTGLPPESSYTVIFGLGAVTGLVALVLIAVSRPRLRPIETVEELTDSRAMNHEWG